MEAKMEPHIWFFFKIMAEEEFDSQKGWGKHLLIDTMAAVICLTASLCQQGEHSGAFTFPHANMQLTSHQQAKSLFRSTYNLPSSSTLLRSLVTWRGSDTHAVGSSRHKWLCMCDGVRGQILTSYFCNFSFSMWSNFSDSSWHIQSCSSLILSLQETRQMSSLDDWSWFVHPFQKCWRTSACLRSGGRCLGLCVWQLESSSSSLSRSLSYLPSSGQPNLTNMEDGFRVWTLSRHEVCHLWDLDGIKAAGYPLKLPGKVMMMNYLCGSFVCALTLWRWLL